MTIRPGWLAVALLAGASAAPADNYQQLFALLDLTRPELAAVRAKVQADDPPGAMLEYRAALAARVAKLPRVNRFSYWLHTPADADRLLKGELLTARYGDSTVVYTVPLGLPGHIDFFKELPNYREIARDLSTMQWVSKYLEAYWKTKDLKYLDAWQATWRDYLAHWDAQWAAVKANPAMWGRGPQREGRILGIEWAGGQTLYCGWRLTTERSGAIAAVQAAAAAGQLDRVDPEVLAGLLVRMVTVDVANGRRILRGAERAVPNQVRGLADEVLTCGLLFPEFKDAPAWRHEALPVLYLNSQPDGTVREQSLNYFVNYFPGLLKKVREGLPPEEQDAALLDKLETLNQYQDRVLPSLARPDGFTPATGTDPVWDHYGQTRPLRPPSTAFTSLYLPYGGYAVQRDGWQPDSLYLFMKTRRPNNGHWRAIDGGLQLSAYGRNLLVSPVGNLYDARDSERGWRPYWEHAVSQNTLVVDGLGAPERKGDYHKLDPWRWHTSSRFDFMETEVSAYAGPDFRQLRTPRDHPLVTDVVHRRQVQFVREAGVWVVTDRVTSKQPHDFTQSWCFGPEFGEPQVVIDAAHRTIATRGASGPNLSLYQCAAHELTYHRWFGVFDERHVLGWAGLLADKAKWLYTPAAAVHVDWREQGEQVLVTLVCPRRGSEAKVASFVDRTAGGVTGFDATLADGRTLHYRAAAGTAKLAAGAVEAEARSLLLLGRTGVVLGARTFVGRAAAGADGEFELPDRFTPLTVPTGFRWTGTGEHLAPAYTAPAPAIVWP